MQDPGLLHKTLSAAQDFTFTLTSVKASTGLLRKTLPCPVTQDFALRHKTSPLPGLQQEIFPTVQVFAGLYLNLAGTVAQDLALTAVLKL